MIVFSNHKGKTSIVTLMQSRFTLPTILNANFTVHCTSVLMKACFENIKSLLSKGRVHKGGFQYILPKVMSLPVRDEFTKI